MNQQCKVCGEPAAGFHFGAFTCEGCKSFFGRSYNNLSSISECKNNGECIINKKNRTACKACRLRKCLLVGMSKSGSRYGRRSNWFKIHCLLQEQQQAQAANNHEGLQKVPALSPNSLNMMRHPSYSTNLFSRPICTKEELLMLRLDDFSKHPGYSSSPSISSPDSHNSDSSVEIGDKRNSMLNKHNILASSSQLMQQQQQQQHQQQQSSLALNKDFFLQLPFAGFPLMPPPGFIPPANFLFSNYHNSFYEHNHQLLQHHVQQGLLKASDSPSAYSDKSPKQENEANDCEKVDIDDDDTNEEKLREDRSSFESKQNYAPFSSNALRFESTQQLNSTKIDDGESDDVLTPPRSPKSPKKSRMESNPIDLSMKSSSNTKPDDIKTNIKSLSLLRRNSDGDSNDANKTNSRKTNFMNLNKKQSNLIRNRFETDRDNGSEEHDKVQNVRKYDESNDEEEYEREIKRRKSHSTEPPLDLTTKV